MFLSNEIESFYQKFSRFPFGNEELVAVAHLCEEWIFSLEPMPDFIAKTTSLINTLGNNYSLYRIYWAFAMALCIPSARTGQLFQERHDFLSSNSQMISECVDDISDALRKGSGHQVDLLTAFSHLPGREYFKTTYECYSTDAMFVQTDAVGWDNLSVLLSTLPRSVNSQQRAIKLLAQFHDPETTQIYRHFITTTDDEEKLFRAQISHLRNSVSGNEHMRWIYKGPRTTTLMPNTSSRRDNSDQDQTVEIFKRPGFAEKVRQDEEFVAREFFQLTDGVYRKPQHAATINAITNAFVDAGLSTDKIISWGILDKECDEPFENLRGVLSQYAGWGPITRDFYSQVFKLHLTNFTLDQIISSCGREKTFECAYALTGIPEILAACSPTTREKCFSSDLGL